MIRKLDEGLIQIRGWLVSCYLLVEGERAWLIDGGFVGDLGRIEKALGGEGLGWENLEGVGGMLGRRVCVDGWRIWGDGLLVMRRWWSMWRLPTGRC